MADKKVSELTALNKLSGDDLLLVVNDPAGTPQSRKISVGNVFGNVEVATTHRAAVTFTSNVVFTSTKVTSTANVAVTGDLSVNGYSVLTELNSKQIASESASELANTNSAIADRLQVANADARFLRVDGVVGQNVSGTLSMSSSFAANVVSVTSNTGLRLLISGTPSSNNPVTEGMSPGSIAFSNTHMYIAVDNNTIKRVPLENF